MSNFKVSKIHLTIIIALLFFLDGCSNKNKSHQQFRDSLTFYASFNEGFEADIAQGDPELYSAPTWERRDELQIFDEKEEFLQIHEGQGVVGDALWIDSESSPVFFYKGIDNMVYERDDWTGTVSFWIRLNPDEDLRDGYSDPIQITSRAWNDGALFVDFTAEDPRTFRFAIIPDREVWDPEEREWGDVPFEERPMLNIPDHPFSKDEWTHVAFSFRNFNTGQNNGRVAGYLNGEFVGSMSGSEKTFTWDPEKVAIWLGYNYRGYFDELAIFNRNLSEEEIFQLYSMRGL